MYLRLNEPMSPEELDIITDEDRGFLLTQEEALDDECFDDEVVLYRWEEKPADSQYVLKGGAWVRRV